MKKAFALALSGIALGNTLEYSQYAAAGLTDHLQAAWSFDSNTPSVSPTFTLNNSFTVENGQGVVRTSGQPWTTSLGSTFASGFTFSFDLVDANMENWRSLLSLYSNGTTNGDNNSLQLQKDGSGNLCVYSLTTNAPFSGAAPVNGTNFSIGTLDSLKGSNITLTYGAGAENGAVMTAYVNGESVGSFMFEGEVATLTGFQVGAAFGNGRKITSAVFDNFAIWNTALTADQVKTLANVPEPATATLSLLALVALAARRRRC